MTTTETKTHPIIIISAIFMILFTGLGIGMMTGLIPNTFAKKDPAIEQQALVDKAAKSAEQAKIDAAAAEAALNKDTPQHVATNMSEPVVVKKPEVRKEVRKPVPHRHTQVARNDKVAVETHQPARQVCSNCGVIESINAVEEAGQGSGLGAITGGVVGGLLGNQVGKGNGKTVATIAGVAGGAYAGNQIEKTVKKTSHYNVEVRMEDGSFRTIRQKSATGMSYGDRVKIIDGEIVRN